MEYDKDAPSAPGKINLKLDTLLEMIPDSQNKLCSNIEVSTVRFMAWKNGEGYPNLKYIERILQHYPQISLSDIIEWIPANTAGV